MKKEATGLETRYSRFKIIMRDPRLRPTDEDEVIAITDNIRKTIKIKYYGAAFTGFLTGILSLVLIVGFFIIPLSFVAIYFGKKEISYLNLCEKRYIEDKEWENINA